MVAGYSVINSAKRWFKKEFDVRNFLPTHQNYNVFVDSQWSKGCIPPWYVTYRSAVALLFLAWPVLDLVLEAGRWYDTKYMMWFMFATNWSLLLLMLSSLVSAVNTIRFYVGQRKQMFQSDISPPPSSIDCGLSFQWLLHSTSSNCAIVVSVTYWIYIIVIDNAPFLQTTLSQLKHSLNTIYVIVDLFIAATPVRLLHFIYPMLIGVVYALFYALYFIYDGIGPGGKSYAYYLLNWRKDPSTSFLTCLLAFAMILLAQVVLYLVHKIRLSLYEKLQGSQYQVDNPDSDDFLSDQDEEEGLNGVQESNLSVQKVPVNYRSID